MLKLSESPKYLKELKEFENAFKSITNEKAKKKLQSLISDLKAQVKMIDEKHISYAGKIDPKSARDNIEDMLHLRLEIQKVIREATNA